MATKYGTQAAKVVANIPSLIEQGQQTGKVHTIYDEYDLADAGHGAITAADVLVMGGMIPAGARVLDAHLDSDDLDAGGTASIEAGWLASADGVEAASAAGLIPATDVHTAASAVSMSASTAAALAGKFKKFASPVQPAITVAGSGNTVTGKIRLRISYIFD